MGATKVGKTLGNFRILECLGSGGAGMIWKAEDASLGRVVALKALRPELAADGDMAQRFRAEARTLAKLSHANVASLYSLIEDDDGLFLVLEYVEGHTLAALLATSGPLPLDTAYALFHQVLDGVGHAHEAGIVHRDLKPANLMVDARGRVKVMDFGIARVAGAERTTHHGKLVGTPEYMSPEQVRGEDATIRSDLYSLGILLFEMVTGEAPFRAPASFELMRAQLEDLPPDPRALRPELDVRVARAILRALAKRPAERFASTRELQDALLDAGASRRGRPIARIWRDLPGANDNEAPTLTTGRGGEAATVSDAESPVVSPVLAPDGGTEPIGAWTRAVDPRSDDLESEPEGDEGDRARAPRTAVMDAAADTSVLPTPPPTRMLADAPFAAHAQSLGTKPFVAPGAARPTGLLWMLAGAALIVGALGLVQLRADDEPEAAAAQTAPTPEPREPAPQREVAPPLPAPAAPAPPRAKREAAASAARALPNKSQKIAPPAAAPEAAPQEDSGWVIRR
ncbi:MAG TPA: serine/threonine-protein kinase [Myxococcota bacterium]|jgi:serine/threonine-protein kinase